MGIKLAKALAEFQKNVKPIHKSAKAQYGDYADLDSMLEAIKEPLASSNLVVTQFPISLVDERGGCLIGIETTVIEIESGESMNNRILLPTSGVPNKNVAQAAGSLLTYLRRYSLAGALSLSAKDDDGDSLTPRAIVSKDVTINTTSKDALLKGYIASNHIDATVAKMWCMKYGVERLGELTEDQVMEIIGE